MGSVSAGPAYRRGVFRAPVLSLAIAALAVSTLLPDPAVALTRRKVTVATEPAVQTPQGPRTILVSIRKQRLRLFDGNREIASSRISSGQPGFDTPTGVFSILEKKVYHESNIYEGAPMPFMQRITWSGIAMHAGVVPGYRASHGCVRLPASFAQSFFQQTDVGGRVIITQDEVTPVSYEHPSLFNPLPENDPAPSQDTSAGEPRVAANDATAADRAALTSLVGTATAAPAPVKQVAAVAAGDRPRSRAELNRRYAQKLQSLIDTMAAAEERKVAASEKAKATVRAAQDAEAKLNDVRRPFEDVLRAASAAEAARIDAARAYRNFLNGTVEKPSEEQKDRKKKKGKERENETAQRDDNLPPEEREQELEDRLLDAVVEVENSKKGSAAAEAAIAQAKAAFEKADADRVQALEEVRTAVVDLRQAQTAVVDAKAEAVRRNRPLSIFISLKAQRLYIRQGFEPIFETPIEVDDPGTIGTHVLTAIGYDQTGDKFVWQLVTAQQPRVGAQVVEDQKGKSKAKGGESVAVNSPLNIEAVTAALDSITVPADIQEQISELARPGTSLIISEKDLSHETGKGTEFVVLTR